MRVVVWVAQLVRQGIQEQVATLGVQVIGQAHEDVQGGLMHGVALRSRLIQIDGLQRTHVTLNWKQSMQTQVFTHAQCQMGSATITAIAPYGTDRSC